MKINRELKKLIGATIIGLVGLYWCKFSLFQSLILALLGMFYWEIAEAKNSLDALAVDSVQKEKSE